MKFESDRIALEWAGAAVPGGTAHIVLMQKQMVQDIQDYAMQVYEWEFFVTCIMRTPEENDLLYGAHGDHLMGVHVTGYGVDVRTKDQDPVMVGHVSDWANARWIYDLTRPHYLVALRESAGIGSSATHLHIQTHSNTTLRTNVVHQMQAGVIN